MPFRPKARLETDQPQQPATGFRVATVILEGRVNLEQANRACRALEALRPGSESHPSTQVDRGFRIYFRYPGEQIPTARIESAAADPL